tara:strand:+ start:493 stop:675 length:183 start_codon:yes stop_codon:yes gene_type:complete
MDDQWLDSQESWARKVGGAVKALLPKGFVGTIEINAFKGYISSVKVKSSIQVETKREGIV